MQTALRKEVSLITGGLALLGLSQGRRRLALGFGVATALLRFWPKHNFRYKNASVVVTGGSRGLGLALAEELVRRGALVSILARDSQELERAKDLLTRFGDARVLTLACDVTDPLQVEDAMSSICEQYGRIDMWINNAGAITVGPFASLLPEDFEAQLRLHLQAVVDTTMLLVPLFRAQKRGHLINISSIGGTLPVPHMSAYCASKFALGGFSESVALELAENGVQVTTVYPGLMQTGSPIQAVFKGETDAEFSWFALSDTLPGLSMSAFRAARQILDGAGEGRSRLVIGWPARFGVFGHAQFPEIYAGLMRTFARHLPGRPSQTRQTGAQARARLKEGTFKRWLTWLSRPTEARWNQKEKVKPEYNMSL